MTRFNLLELAFLGALSLHNLEEAIWLPAWSSSAEAARFRHPIAPQAFRLAVVVLTGLAAVAVAVDLFHPSRTSRLVVVGYAGAMAINALVPHAAASLLTRRYAPGLATGLLLCLPAGAGIVAECLVTGAFPLATILMAIAGVGVLLVAIIPVLFALGSG